jgi:alpha,alpha-trehalase
LIPVDLNGLLIHLEQSISKAYQLSGNEGMAEWYRQAALSRADAIHQYLWSEALHTFSDYNFVTGKLSPYKSMAMAFPLFVKIASPQQAANVSAILEKDFLKQGGLLTSLSKTKQQWDAPNGWAPLQWIGYKAVKNYGNTKLASKISKAWTENVERVFNATGKMMEKYNVEEALEAGGGEYPNQDGFGWTNGVYLKMKQEEQSV